MSRRKYFKRFYRGIIALLLLVFLLVVTIYFVVQSSSFQTFISEKITSALSDKIGTDISVDKVKIDFFNSVKLEEFYIEDLNEDTLMYFKVAKANFSYFSLFDKKISLDNIVIDELDLNLNRLNADTVFNFNFLLPKKKNKQIPKKKDVWDIELYDLKLFNTKFIFNDSLTGTLLTADLPQLKVAINEFNLNEKKFEIKKIKLKKPIVNLIKSRNYKTNKPDFELDIPAFVYVNNIIIDEAIFNLRNLNDTVRYKKMAFNDLKLEDIDAKITSVYIKGDSVSAKINRLILKEKRGLEIKKMNSLLSISNRRIDLDTLHLETNQSIINTKAQLLYRGFKDFRNFKKRVRFKAKLSNTIINPNDFKYFIDTKNIGIGGVIKISGDLSGKLSSLKAKNIHLKAGNRTDFKGKFSLNGLPNIKETFISFKTEKLKTDYDDLKFIHSKIPLPENAKTLGTIHFKGRFDGFYSDFVTLGEAHTNLGVVKTDINLKIGENGIPAYSGHFNVIDFEVGKWFAKDEIGAVTLKSSIKGEGFKINTLNAELKGTIQEITIKDYTYTNIDIDGSLKDKFFKGKANINDEHLKMNFEGLVDATKESPIFNFNATLDKIDLMPLNLSNKDFTLSAKLKSNFSANNIDDIIGNLELNDFKIDFKEKSYEFKRISLNSENHDNEKHLDIKGDNFKLLVHGNYQIRKLPEAFKYIILASDTVKTSPQDLRFDIEITDKTDLISLFLPKLKIPKKILISGNLNTETESILASIDIPRVKFGKTKFNNFISNIKVVNGKIEMINSLPKIILNDSIIVKDISLIAEGYKEDIAFSLNATNNKVNSAIGLKGSLAYAKRLFTLHFDKSSSFLINNSFWKIAENNSLSFNKNVLMAKNFKLSNGNSEANFVVDKKGGTNNLKLNLKDIKVEDFAGILRRKGLFLEGEITGEVKVDNFDIEPAINGNLDFVGISLNKYIIGDFKLNSRVDIPEKKVYISGGLYSKENHIDVNGAYSFNKISTKEDIDIDIFIKQFTIKSFEDLIPKFIVNSSGTLNGNLKVFGARKEPNIKGFVDVNDVTTTVAFTQVKYTIAETKVQFKENIIQLEEGFMLQDDEGNVAYGSGNIRHNNLKDIFINLKVVTDKVKALNTKLKDNDTFYGTAYLNGGATFTGLTTSPMIYIWGKSEEESFINVPFLDDVSNKEHEFYQFVTNKTENIYKEEPKDESVKIRGAKVKLDLNLDENLTLKLILDQEKGDVLKVQGKGDIKIDVGQAGEYVNFFGDYLVSKGDYLFTMQNIVNKPFKIKEGSTINFNGNIYDEATVNMSATYSRRVALDNFIDEYLSESDEELRDLAKARVPVTLFLDLKDKLSKPTIKFDIGIKDVDTKLRNLVDNKLQAIQLNESEMNNQIFGILVLTRFLPSYSALGSTSASSYAGAAVNTITELISNQISRYLTDWASYVVEDLDLFVNYTTYDANDIRLRNRQELQLALTKRFFDDRLSINLGGDFDFGERVDPTNPTPGGSTFFGGNFSFEYSLTKNRRWRAKSFIVSDYDSYNANNRKSKFGVGLSYKREFDDIYDLFNMKNPNKK